MSLADVVAVSREASTLVLIGAPQQLDQSRQGLCPDDAGVSGSCHVCGPFNCYE